MTLLVTRELTPFGVEVDWDLATLRDGADARLFRDLFYDKKLLVFRDQRLSPDDQVRLMSFIGPVLDETRDYREIQSDGQLGGGPLAFHSDLSFTPEPHRALSLHAVDIVEGETFTAFAHAIRAFARLSERQRAEATRLDVLDRLSIVQSHRLVLSDQEAGFLPSHCHPVVIEHPVTGERILYVNEAQTVRIAGFEPGASEALLGALFAALYDEGNIYRHGWLPGDLLVWDNLALQHGRPDLRSIKRRRLQRASVAQRGFAELCPDFSKDDPRVVAMAGGSDFIKA